MVQRAGFRPAGVAGAIWCGLVVCAVQLEAAVPGTEIRATAPAGEPLVADVELGLDGNFRGVAVTSEGTAAADVLVTLWQRDREIARGRTDTLGRFCVSGLRGGVYLARAGRGMRVYRVWPAGTAPPGARPIAMLVATGETLVRGQGMTPVPVVTLPEAATFAAIVGGAIAVPVIYHNALIDNQVPVSP